ncbi:MAG: hypothetical protein ACREO3_12335 [Arenimonas sp.]
MSDIDHLKDDLAYVRAAVVRGRDDRGTAPSYFLWALIIGIGFALPDFAPRAAGWFWVVAGIGGGIASVWLGYRHNARRGVQDPAVGRRHGAHWLLTGIAVAVPMGAIWLGRLPAPVAAPMVLATVGLGYALAGVHLHPPLRWAGYALLAGGVVLLLWPMPYLWTATGLTVALALAIGGVTALRTPAG